MDTAPALEAQPLSPCRNGLVMWGQQGCRLESGGQARAWAGRSFPDVNNGFCGWVLGDSLAFCSFLCFAVSGARKALPPTVAGPLGCGRDVAWHNTGTEEPLWGL